MVEVYRRNSNYAMNKGILKIKLGNDYYRKISYWKDLNMFRIGYRTRLILRIRYFLRMCRFFEN